MGYWDTMAQDVERFITQSLVCTQYRSKGELPSMRSPLADDSKKKITSGWKRRYILELPIAFDLLLLDDGMEGVENAT